MRPIKLEIEGLQSYEKKQIIDFEKLSEYGLFGIFGITGSGKSTIIDAITYAIYGDIVRIKGSSGNNLSDLLNYNSNSLRVHFTYAIGDDIYNIERSRKTKRGSRELSPTAGRVEKIVKNDSVIADSVGEINRVISDTIGLSMDDFTRSVVLPQGKFSEFLKLSGKERRDMLERIFNLEEYGKNLKDKVSIEKNKLKKSIQSIEDQILGKGEDISLENLSLKQEERKNLTSIKPDLELKLNEKRVSALELEKLSEKFIERDALVVKVGQLSKRLEEINLIKSQVSEAEKANLLIVEIDKLEFKENQIFLLEKNLTVLEENLEKNRDKKNTILEKKAGLLEEISLINEELNKNEVSPREVEEKTILSSKANDYSQYIDKEVTLERDIRLNKLTLKDLKSSLIALQGELEELNKITIEPVSESKIFDLKSQVQELNIQEVEKLEEEILKLKDEIKSESIRKKEIILKLDNLNSHIFLQREKEREALAHKLAVNLKEGDSCPVCGSDHHPKKALKDGNSLEEIEESISSLEKSKTTMQEENGSLKVEEKVERLSLLEFDLGERSSNKLRLKKLSLEEEIVKLKETKAIREKEIIYLEKTTACKRESISSISLDIAKIETTLEMEEGKLAEVKDKIKNFVTSIKDINKSYIDCEHIRIDRIDLYIKNIDKRLEATSLLKKSLTQKESISKELMSIEEDLNKNIESIVKDVLTTSTSISHERKEIDTLEKSLELPLREYLSRECVREKSLDSNTIEVLKNKISEYNNEVYASKARLEDLNKLLLNKSYNKEEVDAIKEQIDTLETQIKETTSLLGALDENILKLERELKSISELLEKKEELNTSYERYEELDRIFQGNKFVEFLSIGRLKNISKIASLRLKSISSGRYALTTNESGDFLIVDNFNGGETRKTSTLSGGESFLVSLALALALSSQLQLKGHIELEFFFLDEGFGTLDSQTLDRVITSLETLKDDEKIKVGIITHVEELKDRIPRKAIVYPAIQGERGSKIEIE